MRQTSLVRKMSVDSKARVKVKLRAIILLAFVVTNGLSAQQNVIQQMVNAVSSDSMMKTIRRLQAFGTRYEYTAQRDSAAAYLLNEFTRQGLGAESDRYAFGNENYYDVAVIDQQRMVIVGSDSVILTTSDGGATWKRAPIPSFSHWFYQCYAVCFVNAQLGWAVGTGGTIIHTTDGGNTWREQYTIVSNTLNGISFANERFGVIVGDNGVVVRTSNGGTTWSWSVPTSLTLREVAAVDSLNLWAVGDSRLIIHSSNGGISWTTQSIDTLSPHYSYSVCFTSSQVGWVVGPYRLIGKTTNGGATWNWLRAPRTGTGYYTGVCFIDDSRGWIVDNSGYVISTVDGGTSWQVPYASPNGGWGYSFQKIKASRDGRVSLCGTMGLILTSPDNGKTWIEQTTNVPQQLLHPTRNIVATLPGLVTPGKEIIILAHYDSNDSWEDPMLIAPGANDNGTGTSAVLEAARICKNFQFESTIRFLAVSAEELGMIGSTHYVSEAMKKGSNIIAAVNGDMLGYPTTSDTSYLAIGSYLSWNRLVDSAQVYNQRYRIGLTLAPFVDNTAASDYGPFALAGIDALEVAEGTANDIWGGKDPYYHRPTDTADKLKPGLLRQAARLMLATIAELARPVVKAVSVSDGADVPREFALYQNYPNPFNPTTNFEFRVGNCEFVTLRVFDVLGREVAALVNEVKAAGTYAVTWNATTMPSGVYLCRLQANGFVDTKKMLLIR